MNQPTDQHKEENALICDALETIGTKDVIVVTMHSIVYGTNNMAHLRSLLTNALMQDESFLRLVIESIGGTIGFLKQRLDELENTEESNND
jgi:hypothetical protein